MLSFELRARTGTRIRIRIRNHCRIHRRSIINHVCSHVRGRIRSVRRIRARVCLMRMCSHNIMTMRNMYTRSRITRYHHSGSYFKWAYSDSYE